MAMLHKHLPAIKGPGTYPSPMKKYSSPWAVESSSMLTILSVIGVIREFGPPVYKPIAAVKM